MKRTLSKRWLKKNMEPTIKCSERIIPFKYIFVKANDSVPGDECYICDAWHEISKAALIDTNYRNAPLFRRRVS